VRDDQMVLGLNRNLHVVTNHAGAAAARRHRARIGIGQRDLLIGALEHPRLDLGEAPHLVPELRDLLRSRVILIASASEGSCRSAVSSCCK
jgi:hypothetical protein